MLVEAQARHQVPYLADRFAIGSENRQTGQLSCEYPVHGCHARRLSAPGARDDSCDHRNAQAAIPGTAA
ncbi:hypothetical protein C791_2098 [Amycolatopsis azurea DSM 43854]|uniref:Uncharacterized protein n=1 Tax=Amycolatopsis azurea DSM 43854 TaxID=1238180 RepID=M2Q669_9PSEU|nr:hypothetical protein C791_2098 [Amycolatopsis azurea DSM 43854]